MGRREKKLKANYKADCSEISRMDKYEDKGRGENEEWGGTV